MAENFSGTVVSEINTDDLMRALSNPNFKWRTVHGVSSETGMPVEVVTKFLAENPDKIVKSSVAASDGSDLFTTRDHFRQTSSVLEKLRGALLNRA